MEVALPGFATVRPRVRLMRTGDVHLIEDVVGEMAESLSTGVIRISGGPGSGKSIALAHLAAVLSLDEHVHFLDEPTPEELERERHDFLVVAATSTRIAAGIELALLPW